MLFIKPFTCSTAERYGDRDGNKSVPKTGRQSLVCTDGERNDSNVTELSVFPEDLVSSSFGPYVICYLTLHWQVELAYVSCNSLQLSS